MLFRSTVSSSNSVSTFKGELLIDNAGGVGGSAEGGELHLAAPTASSNLSGPIAIDIYQNRIRFFETSGTNRGAYIDLTSTGASVGTNLLAGATSVTSVGGQTGAISNTQILTFLQAVSSTNNVTFDYVASSNNGYGQNFKVGDDAWIGDYNAANSIKIKGQQDATNGYIAFGNSTLSLGQSANGPLTFGGSTVWHAANDGAGSGLDADYLDGQHGSYYATDTKAQAAWDKANSAGVVANTDYTSISATAGTYGNAAYIPVTTLTANGRVSSITNTAIAIDASQISSGTIANARFITIGTSGTYGSASIVPVFTVDTYGRVTAVTNTTISIPSTAVKIGRAHV